MEDFLNGEDFEESAFAAWFSSLEPTAQAEYIERLEKEAGLLERQRERMVYCAPALDYWVIKFWDHQSLLMNAATATMEVATFVAGSAEASCDSGTEEAEACLLASSRLPISMWVSYVGLTVLSHAALDKWIETILEVLLIEQELRLWKQGHPDQRLGLEDVGALSLKVRQMIVNGKRSPIDQASRICELLGQAFDLDYTVLRAWCHERGQVRNRLAHGPRVYARPLSKSPVLPPIVSDDLVVGPDDFEAISSVSVHVMLWMIRALENANLLLPFEDEMLHTLEQTAQEGRAYWFGKNRRTDGLL